MSIASTCDRLLTVPSAAERLGIQPRTLRGWLASGRLPCVRLSARAVRIDARDLAAFVDARRG